MDKQTLNTVSKLVAEESIGKPNKDESFADYVQRMYPEFESFVSESDNSIISEIESDSADALRNAISKLEVRRQLVTNYCRVNDPFELEPPKEATDEEILAHNEVKGDVETLRNAMGEKAFENYLKDLKTPKKDGKTKTEIKELREQHYANYEPAFPSNKEYTHGSGGSTRNYHWESGLQDAFLEDHVNFLVEFGLEDSFVEDEDSDEQE